MAEVLGAVASATQLAAMAMGLIDTVQKIKGASKTLKRYQQQLVEIQHLSESISRNPLLQTTDVENHIQSILSNISQTNLEHCLRKGWLFRAYTLIHKDRDLVDSFSILDRQKLSLSLVIDNIQAHAIHQIRSDVQTLSCTSRTRTSMNPDTPPHSENEDDTTTKHHATSIRRPRKTKETKVGNMSAVPGSRGWDAATESRPQNHEEQASNTPKGLHFYNTDAGPGANQYSGLTFQHGLLKPGEGIHRINPDGSDTFTNTTKVGSGEQRLGQTVFVPDGTAIASNEHASVEYNVTFIDSKAMASPNADAAGMIEGPNQFQGRFYIPQPKFSSS